MTPEIRDVRHIVQEASECSCYIVTKDGSGYVPLRTQGWGQITPFQRIRAAWMVFTGRADAVTYPGQP